MCKKVIVDEQLDKWLGKQDRTLFPEGVDYNTRYTTIAERLNRDVHTEIEKGAILAHIEQGDVDLDKIVYLNNHGPGHIEKVIKKASNMLNSAECTMSPYEGYILLAAIQFHDVGNIYGRQEHEKKCKGIMESLGSSLGQDRPEKNAIAKIAAAHGGCNDGDEDTIGRLERKHPLLGEYVRKQYLAAILRLADELSDDRTRAARFLMNEGRIPPSSEIYHEYSNSLHTVMVDREEILLRFEIDRTRAIRKFKKGNGKEYLLDEIYERTLKMHRERMYCMRFLKPDIDISRVCVRIEVCTDISRDTLSDVVEKINYCLEEKGYPRKPHKNICGLCPELLGKDGKWLKELLK